MNYWTQMSVTYANQKNYLDELYKVYPIVPDIRRTINENLWSEIENSYNNKDNASLVKSLLKTELFPIKDSFVAYLRSDPSAIDRNPNTINRLAGNLLQLSLDKIYERCTEPKETNRTIGPMFKRWLDGGFIGCKIFKSDSEFLTNNENAILNASDGAMKSFAEKYLGYTRKKGLDLVARFNNKYIIAEAKFLTGFGGNQDNQFDDAVYTLTTPLSTPNALGAEVIKIAVLDGVLYIENNGKMHKYLKEHPDQIILSSLVLREFLYSL